MAPWRPQEAKRDTTPVLTFDLRALLPRYRRGTRASGGTLCGHPAPAPYGTWGRRGRRNVFACVVEPP
eukprot:scaffold459_cov249-Pinguiococcus_pyrenoidosus.AAC.22